MIEAARRALNEGQGQMAAAIMARLPVQPGDRFHGPRKPRAMRIFRMAMGACQRAAALRRNARLVIEDARRAPVADDRCDFGLCMAEAQEDARWLEMRAGRIARRADLLADLLADAGEDFPAVVGERVEIWCGACQERICREDCDR